MENADQTRDTALHVTWRPGRQADGGERYFFAFAEEVAPVLQGGPYHGPANDSVQLLDAYDLSFEYIGLRFSGIDAETFFAIVGEFDVLPGGNPISRLQRSRRRRHLREHLLPVSLPVFHIFLEVDDTGWQWLGSTFDELEWYVIEVHFDAADIDLPSVFMAVPEEKPDASTAGKLLSIARPHPDVLMRLRDIFSLSHIPDADFDERGGTLTTPPRHPLSGDDQLHRQAPLDAPLRQMGGLNETEARAYPWKGYR